MDYYEQLAARPSYQDSLKVLEADIQHANMLWVNPFSFYSYCNLIVCYWVWLSEIGFVKCKTQWWDSGFLFLVVLCSSVFCILLLWGWNPTVHCPKGFNIAHGILFVSVYLVLFLMGWFSTFSIQGLLIWGWEGLFVWRRKEQRENDR